MSKKTKSSSSKLNPHAPDKVAKLKAKGAVKVGHFHFGSPHASHDVRNGVCAVCGRTGADLVPTCPGYRTAADIQRRTK